jgi:hypothetical protein
VDRGARSLESHCWPFACECDSVRLFVLTSSRLRPQVVQNVTKHLLDTSVPEPRLARFVVGARLELARECLFES